MKRAGSLALFLAGLYLLMMGVLTGGLYAVNELIFGDGPGAVKESLEADYQNTARFRSYVGNKLEELLVMAVGGWNGSWGDYGIPYEDYESGETTVYEAVTVGSGSSEFRFRGLPGFSWDVVMDTASETPVLMQEPEEQFPWEEEQEQEQRPQTKEEYYAARNKEMAKDINLLYRISCDGEVKYTNAEGSALDGETGRLPEGYNFLLYFDGEKTHIYKDGEELAIYGDGWYEPGKSQWYVPGYENFKVDEEAKKVRVTMAVIRNPRLYVEGTYAGGNVMEYGSRLYQMSQSQYALRRAIIKDTAMLLLGILLLVLSAFCRKQKKTADQWLAAQTGKWPFEGKLLLFLGLCLILWPFWARLGYRMENGRSAWALLLLELLLVYLAQNDLRLNRGRQKSWVKALARFLRTRELALPVQKRMAGRSARAVFCCLLAVLCLGLSLVLLWIIDEAYWISWWEVEWLLLLLWGTSALSLVLALVLAPRYLVWNRKLAEDVGRLDAQVERIREGNLTDSLELPKDHDLRKTAENLNDIQQGMNRALQEQMKSERMKVELVSNVSHDLKTPLTSIISYVELLKEETELPEHVKDYVRILDQKAERLRAMVQDVFEVSRAASGQLPVEPERLELKRLLAQTLADMEERIQKSGMQIKTEFPEEELLIRADGQRMYRVFQNLLQNALQYSLEGSRIYIGVKREERLALVSVRNVSRQELPKGVDFTARFVRGDESRTDGGSGLGLSIAKSFTEACGGSFTVQVQADLFTALVRLPLWEEETGAAVLPPQEQSGETDA